MNTCARYEITKQHWNSTNLCVVCMHCAKWMYCKCGINYSRCLFYGSSERTRAYALRIPWTWHFSIPIWSFCNSHKIIFHGDLIDWNLSDKQTELIHPNGYRKKPNMCKRSFYAVYQNIIVKKKKKLTKSHGLCQHSIFFPVTWQFQEGKSNSTWNLKCNYI